MEDVTAAIIDAGVCIGIGVAIGAGVVGKRDGEEVLEGDGGYDVVGDAVTTLWRYPVQA